MSQHENLENIVKTVTVQAPIEKVWSAVATSEGIASWWIANTFAPVSGKNFILQTEQFGDSPCIVTDIEPMYRVGFDWGKDWHLEFLLNKLSDTSTEFTLIHSGWNKDTLTEFDQPHPVIHGVMSEGWEKIIKEHFPKVVAS